MKIICKEHYDKVVHYARSIGDTTLQECIDRLKQWEQNSALPCEIEIHYDWAPYSFLFKQRYADGKLGIVGGLVYHGSPDRSCCFSLTPITGWAIHT